jgi:hypothetical protein
VVALGANGGRGRGGNRDWDFFSAKCDSDALRRDERGLLVVDLVVETRDHFLKGIAVVVAEVDGRDKGAEPVSITIPFAYLSCWNAFRVRPNYCHVPGKSLVNAHAPFWHGQFAASVRAVDARTAPQNLLRGKPVDHLPR